MNEINPRARQHDDIRRGVRDVCRACAVAVRAGDQAHAGMSRCDVRAQLADAPAPDDRYAESRRLLRRDHSASLTGLPAAAESCIAIVTSSVRFATSGVASAQGRPVAR